MDEILRASARRIAELAMQAAHAVRNKRLREKGRSSHIGAPLSARTQVSLSNAAADLVLEYLEVAKAIAADDKLRLYGILEILLASKVASLKRLRPGRRQGLMPLAHQRLEARTKIQQRHEVNRPAFRGGSFD